MNTNIFDEYRIYSYSTNGVKRRLRILFVFVFLINIRIRIRLDFSHDYLSLIIVLEKKNIQMI